MISVWPTALLILLPLFAAALAFVFPAAARHLALGTVPPLALANAYLIRGVHRFGTQVFHVGGWGAPLGIDLRVDGLAAFMVALTCFVTGAISLYASRYFGTGHDKESGQHFWPLFLLLWAALNALFLSADIFNLYVTLELLGFAAVALVALAGSREALVAAMRYFIISIAASLFYLLGVALVYGRCATVDLTLLASKTGPDSVLWVALALMTGGLIVKSALFPMHFWLPPAHANAPAPVSALLSALVVKGSFYILLRLWFEAFPSMLIPWVAQIFGILGAAAIFWGASQALLQSRLKLLIAYSTVAQMGYLFLVFPLAGERSTHFEALCGAIIMLAAHACAKTAMFLTAGNVSRAAGHDRIRDLDGMTHVLPLSSAAFGLSALSLIGLPPSMGFAGKWLILSSGLAQGKWAWTVVVLAGALLTSAYAVRVLTHAFTRVSEPMMPNPISPVMEWTALGMAVLAAILGFMAVWPAELLRVGFPALWKALPQGPLQ